MPVWISSNKLLPSGVNKTMPVGRRPSSLGSWKGEFKEHMGSLPNGLNKTMPQKQWSMKNTI